MTVSFFRNKTNLMLAAMMRAKLADICLPCPDNPAMLSPPFTRQGGHQLILAITRNTGNAQNLASMGGKIDLIKGHFKRAISSAGKGSRR